MVSEKADPETVWKIGMGTDRIYEAAKGGEGASTGHSATLNVHDSYPLAIFQVVSRRNVLRSRKAVARCASGTAPSLPSTL